MTHHRTTVSAYMFYDDCLNRKPAAWDRTIYAAYWTTADWNTYYVREGDTCIIATLGGF